MEKGRAFPRCCPWQRGIAMGALQQVKIYTDGSSRGNPGPGGYGALLQYVDRKGVLHERELSAGYRRTTNNRMELMGVIAGLEALRHPCQVEVLTDSRYVSDAFNLHWVESWQRKGWVRKSGPVKNADLWKRLLEAGQPHELRFTWVRGHAGESGNERCDRLATAAAEGESLLEDAGWTDDGDGGPEGAGTTPAEWKGP